MRQKPFIIVRGGGDLATGTIHRLWAAGFPVLVLETEHPAAIRRQVAVCEAVYEGSATVEGMEAVLIKDTAEAKKVHQAHLLSLPSLILLPSFFSSYLFSSFIITIIFMVIF